MADEILATAPVLRFAPSPNGALHLGHAYSALMNDRIAVETNGRVLLRIEDLDRTRCKPQFEAAIVDDLAWLGLRFPAPRRQSEHGDDYAAALARLDRRGLVFAAGRRSRVSRMVSAIQTGRRSMRERAARYLR
jgi:glutamyl-Q tRNA(Asp) synthetase